jgi:hypothetical protein
MRSKRRIKAETHIAGSLGWRRIGVLVWLSLLWVMLMWLVWCFPLVRSDGISVHTTYGILQWQEGRSSRAQAGTVGRLLPAGIAGRSWINPVALAFSIVISAAGSAFLVVYGHRWLRNLTPRWKCRHCGHVVRDGFPQSNVCSECGELPNLQKDPWAFWS